MACVLKNDAHAIYFVHRIRKISLDRCTSSFRAAKMVLKLDVTPLGGREMFVGAIALEPCGWLKDLRFDVCFVNFCGQEIGVFESNLFYKTKKRISASPLPEGEKVMKIR